MKFNFRLGWFATLALVIVLLLFFFAPQQLPVILDKLALVLLAATVGYWLDRHLFPYGRPHDVLSGEPSSFNASMIRRAIIVGATMLAVAIGL